MEEIKWFIKNFPDYVEKMKNCSYHHKNHLNLHHLEENVWTHTSLAYLQAVKFNVSKIIKWAILLHDIGRIYTRKIDKEEEYVSFGDFEGVSIYAGLEILTLTDLTLNDKIRVFKIISYHYTMIDYLKYNDPNLKQIVEKFKYDDELLADLADYVKCDLFGRLIDKSKAHYYDENKIMQRCNFIKTIKYNKPKNSKQEKDYSLYIIVGPPCSGKSSWIENYKNKYYLISRDNITLQIGKKYGKFTYDEAYDLADENKIIKNELLDLEKELESKAKNINDRDIIVDNPNLKIKSRREWILNFKETHNIKVVLFLTPLNELINRDEKRKEKGKTITQKGIINKLKTFEFPLFSEGIDKIEYLI